MSEKNAKPEGTGTRRLSIQCPPDVAEFLRKIEERDKIRPGGVFIALVRSHPEYRRLMGDAAILGILGILNSGGSSGSGRATLPAPDGFGGRCGVVDAVSDAAGGGGDLMDELYPDPVVPAAGEVPVDGDSE